MDRLQSRPVGYIQCNTRCRVIHDNTHSHTNGMHQTESMHI